MIINLTPHKLNINAREGVVSVAPSGDIARVDTATRPLGEVEGIPVVARVMGAVEGLPAPREGVFFVVSALVAGHDDVRGRADVFSPGELVRDAEGRPIGCRGLVAAAGVAS